MSSLLEKIVEAKPGQKPVTFGLKPKAVRHDLLKRIAEPAPQPKTVTPDQRVKTEA